MTSKQSKTEKEAEQMILRKTISKSGTVTEHQVPLSSLKRDAIDLGADYAAMTFLLTKEAAIRITEHAISQTLDKTWNQLLDAQKEKQKKASPDDGTNEISSQENNPNSTKFQKIESKPNNDLTGKAKNHKFS